MKISTRHVTHSTGFQFIASLDTDSIELQSLEREVGTTVEIYLDENLADQLVRSTATWDWYVWRTPSVVRTVEGVVYEQQHFLPRTIDEASPEWLWFKADAQTVFWRPMLTHLVACNGIRVHPGYVGTRSWVDEMDPDDHPTVLWPDLVVVDPDATFPLNLTRTTFNADVWPHAQQLFHEIAKDLAAALLELTPEAPPWKCRSDLESCGRLVNPPSGFGRFIYWSDGVSIYDKKILSERTDYILLVPERCLRLLPAMINGEVSFPVSVVDTDIRNASAERLNIAGTRKHTYVAWITGDNPDPANYRMLTHGACGPSRLSNPETVEVARASITETYLGPLNLETEYSFIAEEVIKILGDSVVPYSLSQRRKKFKPAIERLGMYIERWRTVRKEW
jgi:hypothetical protein